MVAVHLKMRNVGLFTLKAMKLLNVTFVKTILTQSQILWNTGKANMELWYSSVKIRKNVYLEVHAGSCMKSWMNNK